MKIVWAVVMIAVSLQGHSNEQLFEWAQKEYENNNFDKARELFEKIKPASAPVWYNIAACYFHLGNDLEALLHWQRAYQYGTGFLVYESAARIADLEAKLGIEHSCSIVSSVLQSMRAHLQSLSLLLLQILFFCAFSVFLFVASRLRVGKNYFVSGSSGLLVLVLASMVSLKYTQQATRVAVVFEDNATLLVGPNHEYHSVGKVNAGTCVVVTQHQDNWCKINGERVTGWVEKKSIALV